MKTNKPHLALTSATLRSKQRRSHNLPPLSRPISTQLSSTRALPHPTQPLHPPLLLTPQFIPLHPFPRPAPRQQTTNNPIQSAPLTIGCTPSFQHLQTYSRSATHARTVHRFCGARGRRTTAPTLENSTAIERTTPKPFSLERPADPRYGSPVPQLRSTTTPPLVQPLQQQPPPFAQPKRPLHGSHSTNTLLDTCRTFAIPGTRPFHGPTMHSSPDHSPIRTICSPTVHQSLLPPQPQPPSTFLLGDPAQPQPHSQRMLPPAQPSRPQRVQPGQEEYRPEEDPWCNYGRGWEHQ